MRNIAAALVALCLAQPATAGVDAVLDDHALPGFDRFAAAAAALDRAAAADCLPAAVAPPYHAAFDAWMAVADLRLGPSEAATLSIAFWPDARGFTRRSLSRLIADEDPVARDPQAYAEVSVAARGLMALDMLLFDPDVAGYGPHSYTCALVRVIAADLANQAAALSAAWRDGFADTLRTAGAPDNATFLDQDEALRALYTQLLGALEFTADQRLGRPMGTFDRPRPTRAEAWRSGRPLRNVLASVDAAQDLAHALAETPLPETDAAAARVHALAKRIDDPSFQNVSDLQKRLRLEVLQQAVRDMRAAIEQEVGAPLDIAPGFNSQDGD